MSPCTSTINLYHLPPPCTSTMYLYHVLQPCTSTMYLYHVPLPCTYTMYLYHVPRPCASTMYLYHVPLPCTATVYLYHVRLPSYHAHLYEPRPARPLYGSSSNDICNAPPQGAERTASCPRSALTSWNRRQLHGSNNHDGCCALS